LGEDIEELSGDMEKPEDVRGAAVDDVVMTVVAVEEDEDSMLLEGGRVEDGGGGMKTYVSTETDGGISINVVSPSTVEEDEKCCCSCDAAVDASMSASSK
jgi:hypothetical protein